MLDTLIKFINVEQIKINKLYNSGDYDKILLKIDNFVGVDIEEKGYYYVNTYLTEDDKKNSFLYSLMLILDNNFIFDTKKTIYINELRKKLCYDIEVSYRKFNYVMNRKMKKVDIQTNLLKLNEKFSEMTKKYIVDYFGINLYIFPSNGGSNVNVYYATNDNNVPVVLKPTIFMLNNNDVYYPIMNKMNNIIIYADNKKLLDKLFIKYSGDVETEAVPETEQEAETEVEECKDDGDDKDMRILRKSVGKILLAELHKICEKRGISVVNDKGKKKTKQELYDELKNI